MGIREFTKSGAFVVTVLALVVVLVPFGLEQIVTKGSSLSAAITSPREAEVYPGLVRQMIRAGEEAGKLAEMLRPIVDFYEDQAKALLRRTMDMMTPAMIILLGAMIGPVIIGVYKTLIILSKSAAS